MPLDSMDYQQIKLALRDCLREEGVVGHTELGARWHGGKIVIMPGNPALKPKEIAIDDFFHKVVMVRDRLRVLEQKVNSNKNLAEAEKVELQQYVTRCYGSLTTFNALFKEKSDFFSGSGVAKSENGTPAAVVRRRRD
jgi:hypothetical protein